MKQYPILWLLLTLFSTPLPALSEIVITSDAIRVDPDVPEPRLQIAVELPGGFIMRHRTCPWGEFKIHLPELADTAEHLSPSISGNTGTMSLYDWNRGKQALYCGEIYQMSDARNKENIEDLPPTLQILAATTIQPKRAVRAVSSIPAIQSELETYKAIAPSSVVFADGDTLINDTEVIAALIKSAQELRQLVDSQDKTISQLHKAIENERMKSNIMGRIVSCSPNPADAIFNVLLEDLSKNNTYVLNLINLDGTPVITAHLNTDETQKSFNISSAPSGVYHLVLSCNGSVADTFRIIINH